MDIEVTKLLKQEFIRPSKSSCCNNIVPVLKPNGSVRLTVNLKLLNQIVKSDKYSLPLIEEIIHGLRDQAVFSKIDLKDGFFHIPIKEGDKHKTAFRIRLYEWNVKPEGFVNSPSIFQRFMDNLLQGLIGKYCYVYVDDILIFGKDENEHDKAYNIVMKRLSKAGLNCNKEKCKYKTVNIEYLGYIINKNSIALSLNKKGAIENMSFPKTKEELQHFMGVINYYRKFIKDCAKKSENLLKMLRKDEKFEYRYEAEKEFNDLKNELLSPKILRQPDYKKEFILETDACAYGIGAVLTQKFEDGEHPIIYMSRRLKNAELNYSIDEKELLAALWAMEQLHYYLYGRKFILRTDHKSLEVFNCKGEIKSAQIERWSERLSYYSFKVEYRAGNKNLNADALSRKCNVIKLKNNDNDYDNEKITQIIWDVHKELIHRGAKITHKEIIKRFGNITSLKFVQTKLKNCIKCKMFAPRNYPGIKFQEAFEPGEKFAIDIFGTVENKNIIVGIDYFTRRGFAMVLNSRASSKVISFLGKIKQKLPLKLLINDNAKELTSDALETWLKKENIKHHKTTPYHHQANGKAERFIRTVRERLQKYEGKGPLKVKLVKVVETYNNIIHYGTGFTPNEAMNKNSWDELKKKQYENRIQKYKKYQKPGKFEKYERGQKVLGQTDIIIDKQEQNIVWVVRF